MVKKKNNCEEKIMHKDLDSWLQTIGAKEIITEISIPIKNFNAKAVRLDFVGKWNHNTFIIECKKNTHPAWLAQGLGQLLVYKNLLLMNKDYILETYNFKVTKPICLFMCFRNDPDQWGAWTPNHDSLLHKIEADLKTKIGVLFIGRNHEIIYKKKISDMLE